MVFVHISDLHNQAHEIDVPSGDCLIISGDFTNLGTIPEIARFNAWLGTQPHKYKICVAGNHEWLFETSNALARSLITNAVYLQDEEVTIEGIRIYGSPWQPAFCNWAFNLPVGLALKAKWDMIPQDIDILVTHSPPRGVGDHIVRSGGLAERLGCHDLWEAVLRVRPKFHLFGHIHYAHGYYDLQDLGITFMNSAICDELYQPVNKPQVFEFTAKP